MNEREIISSVLGGDTRRFEVLVDRYLPTVRGLCAGRVFNTSVHDDLVQETFIEGYVHLDRLRNPDRFGPWLVAIAKNKCREWLRRQGQRERLAERLVVETQPTVDPSLETNQQELREWVRRRIAALPEKLRDAMMLCYGEGLSTAEAARCLGVRESALRKRLQYGREAIGAELMAGYREEIGPEKSERLRGKVLAAIPLGTLPWRGAGVGVGVSSAALGTKGALFALPIVAVMVCLGGAFVLHGTRTSPWDAPARPTGQAFPSLASTTGAIEVRVHAGTGLGNVSIANLPVKATPIRWDDAAWEEMLRAAGVPAKYKDLLAPCLKDNISKEDLKESWSRQGLGASQIAEAEKHLNTFRSAFMEGRLPANLRYPLQGDVDKARSSTTDNGGRATFAGLPEGTYSIQVTAASTDRSLGGGASVSLKERETARADVTLLPLGCPPPTAAGVDAVLGLVVNEKTGEPVAGASVEIGSSNDFVSSGFVRTDAQGHFGLGQIAFPFGTLYAHAKLDTALSKVVEFEHKEGESASVELRLTPRGTISGRVTAADGRPAPKIPIMLKSVRGDTARSVAHTDDDGRYSFIHDGGAMVLNADGDSVETEPVTVELGLDESRTLDFVLPKSASASFDLRLPDGSSPEKIRVNGFWTEEAIHSFGKELTRQGDSFVLTYLKPAAYRILVQGEGFEGQVAEFVIDEKLTDVVQTLHVQPARMSARILLQDSQGKPVAKGRIHAMWRFGRKFDSGEDTSTYSATSIAEIETRADGIAEFKGLPPARYDFDTDDALQLHDIDVPCNLLLQLRKPAQGNAPATAVPLEYYPFHVIDTAHENSQLDLRDAAIFALTPSGKLSETEMEVGPHTVYIIKRGYTAAVCQVTITPEQINAREPAPKKPVDAVVGEGGRVSGYLDGGSVAGRDLGVFPEGFWETAYAQQVAETSEGNAWAWQWARFGRILAQHAVTDDDGSFTLRFLPPGRYVLATDTDKPGVLLVSEPVTVVAGKETTSVVLTEHAPSK